jgi:hypothetical protein
VTKGGGLDVSILQVQCVCHVEGESCLPATCSPVYRASATILSLDLYVLLLHLSLCTVAIVVIVFVVVIVVTVV